MGSNNPTIDKLLPTKIYSSEILEEIYQLRASVLIDEGIPTSRFPTKKFRDSFESTAHHWAILDKGQVIAAARLSIHQSINDVPDAEAYIKADLDWKPPIASINRLVVHQNYRKLGLGTKLDLVRLEAAQQLGCNFVVGTITKQTGQNRVLMLEKLGFKLISSEDLLLSLERSMLAALVLRCR